MKKEIFEVIPLAEVVAELRPMPGINAATISEIIKQLEHTVRDWITIADWEEIPDQDLYQQLENAKTPSGMLLIVTEVSYRTDLGAFKVAGSDVKQFVAKHRSRFGECFFNGDVLIVSKEQNTVWLFQHEGVFTVLCRSFQ